MSTRHVSGSGRAEILAAATKEFADRGYAGATTAGIARLAGVTQPLVHHHFGSKQGLWDAVIEELFKELHTLIQETLREVEGLDRRTRLAHLLRTAVFFSGRRPEFSRLVRTESSAGGEAFDVIFDKWRKGPMAFLLNELSAATEEGTLRPIDSKFAYFALIGAITQPFAEPRAAQRSFELDMRDERVIARYADFVVDMVLRGLLSPQASSPPDESSLEAADRPTPRKGSTSRRTRD
ncbi:TetR/AcrR family transcriptional regulator [Archangium violaceum]|uniref:TetR family transcriptional regulator n=1 Tax=Archangium violaceum TaxID=83451 RepID=UPI002B2C3FD2|nr:TetR/AcrR family transcriptional regulator [Archangium violaceum]